MPISSSILLKKTDKDPVPQPKQIAFRHNRIHDGKDLRVLHYHTLTHPGASGSPVINDSGELIGLHYAHCLEADRLLYKHAVELCEKLGYILVEETWTEYHFKKGENSIYVFRTKASKGSYSYEIGGEKFKLRKLILNECPNLKKTELGQYLFDFLHSQGEKIKEDHRHCNTAINMDYIFNDLKKRDRAQDSEEKEIMTKERHMEQAIQDAKTVWDRYLFNLNEPKRIQEAKEKDEAKRKKIKWVIGLVGLLLVGGVYYKWGDSIKDSFGNLFRR